MLSDFGSYYAGGTTIQKNGAPIRDIQVTDAFRLAVDENGMHSVLHGYVQYFVPTERNNHPPIVLVHGGGLCGSVWEQTPDGRQGWLHRLLRNGYEVHVLDSAERGRAGWSPHVWTEPPLTRTLQDAWQLFRFGLSDDFDTLKAFPNLKFPISNMIEFGRFFVPRWASQAAAQIDALAAVLRRFEKCTIICHSQGSETAFGAAELVPRNVQAIIALEPSGFPSVESKLTSIPLLLVAGDYLNINPFWQSFEDCWRQLVKANSEGGAFSRFLSLNDLSPGYSHMFMQDRFSDEALDFIMESSGAYLPRIKR